MITITTVPILNLFENEDDINNVLIKTESNHAVIGGGIVMSGKASSLIGQATITDKEFYKAMQKLKDRGSNAVPPKKSASAYILFGKEVRGIMLTF